MATRKKNRSSILDFDRGPDYVPPWEREMQERERQRLLEEEEYKSNPFAKVTGGASTVPVDVEEPSFFERAGKTATSLLYPGTLLSIEESEDDDSLSGLDAIKEQYVGSTKAKEAASLIESLYSLSDAEIEQEFGGRRGWLQEVGKAKQLMTEGQKQAQIAEDYYERTGNTLARTAGDIASNKESLYSILGGIVGGVAGSAVLPGPGTAAAGTAGAALGSIPMAKVAYDSAFAEAITSGVPENDARNFATAMSSSEFLFELAGGKAISKIGLDKAIKDQLKKRILTYQGRALAGTGLAATAGYLEEAATELGQSAMTELWRGSGIADPELQKLLTEQVPRDVNGAPDFASIGWTAHRAGLAGAGMGGGAIAPIKGVEAAYEKGRLVANLKQQYEAVQKVDKAVETEIAKAPITAPASPVPVITPEPEQLTLFERLGMGQGGEFEAQEAARRRELEIDAGITVGRKRAAAEEVVDQERLRPQLQIELDRARQEQESLQDRVESGDTSQATLSSLAAANRKVRRAEIELNNLGTPEEVQTDEVSLRAAPAIPSEPVQDSFQFPEIADRQVRDETVVPPSPIPATQERRAGKEMSSERRAELQGILNNPNSNSIERDAARILLESPLNKSRTTQETIPDAPTKVAPRAARNKANAKPVVTKRQETLTAKEELENLKKGLFSVSEDAPAGTTIKVQDVVNALVNTIGSGSSQALARLSVSGNMQIVPTADNIPANAVPLGTVGYYDGTKTYVVADRLDPKNVVGDMLDIMAHEVKHGADLSADGTLRATMGEFVGEEANQRLVSQITKLANTGNTVAAAALESARSAVGDDARAFQLELPAYFISEARKHKGSVGRAAAVVNNIVSAVRTTAKYIMPGQWDVNLNDVAYLSDKLIKEVVKQDVSLKADDSTNLGMIAGMKARFAEEQDRVGLTYYSKDGKKKFWMSDKDSNITIPGMVILTREKRPHAEWAGKLSDVLKHEALYRQYPQLQDYTVIMYSVSVSTGGSTILGGFDSGKKTILLDWDYLESGYNGLTHQILLHEVQHAVQNIEGSDSGTSPSTILQIKSPDYSKNKATEKATTKMYEAIGTSMRNGDFSSLGITPEEIKNNPAIERAVDAALSVSTKNLVDSGLSPELATVVEVTSYLADHSVTRTPEVQQHLRNLTRFSELRHQNYVEEKKAFDLYQDKLGETEARYTQSNIDLEEDLGPINPEQSFRKSTWTGSVDEEGGIGLAMSRDMPLSEKVGKDEKAQSEITRAAKRLLVPGGGFDPQLGEILRHSSNLPASLAARGTHLGNDFLRAISKNANGKDEVALREQISDQLEAIDKIEDKDQRRAAVRALDRKWPGVGSAVNNIREFKLSLTREIMDLRARDSKPLTDKERALYTKMANNAERYATRAYLATYNKDIGKSYGKHLLKQFKIDPTSEEGRKVAAASEYLINNELTIPEPEVLNTLKIAKLRRLHQTWIGSTKKMKGKEGKALMIKNLSSLAPKTKEEVNRKSMEVIRDMLGQSGKRTSTAKQFIPGLQQNRTILNSRTDIPKELRDLLGEIRDPFLREAISLQRMIALVAKTKALTEIFEKGNGKWWSESRNDKFDTQLSGINYGPLDGKWISQDSEDALTGTIISLANMDSALADNLKQPDLLMKTMLGATLPITHRIMGIQKTWQVVASMFNMALNLSGAIVLMAPSQGIVNPVTMARGMRDTIATLALEVSDVKTTPGQISLAEEVLFAGVTDSATMGEFKSQAFQLITDQIKKLDPADKNFFTKSAEIIWKGISAQGPTANVLRQVYAFMDVWVKVATYIDRKKFLNEYNTAEGKGWTDEEIIRRAGYEAAGTNISYERSIPLVRTIERNVPFAMFLTYFSEVPRAVTMSYIQAYRDYQLALEAKTPKGKALAATKATTRLIGTTVATAGVIGTTMHALDSEDEDERRRRMLDAEYLQDQLLIPLGENKDGNEVMLTLNRVDPYGPLNETLVQILRAPDDKKIQAGMSAISDLFVPSRGFLSILKLVTDATVSALATATGKESVRKWDQNRKKTTAIEANYPVAYNAIRNFLDGAGDIGENAVEVAESMFIPASVMPIIDKNRTQISEVREGDWDVGGVARAMGAKAYVRDPDKSLQFRTYDYNDTIKQLKKEQKELNDNIASMDTNMVIRRMTDILEREKEAFNTMADMWDGYLAYEDRTPAKAAAVVNNKKLARRLHHREFRSDVVKSDTLKKWYEGKLKDRTVDRQQLREDYKVLREVYLDTLKGTEDNDD